MRTVRFIARSTIYMVGEKAGFFEADAARLVAAGVAVYDEPEDPQTMLFAGAEQAAEATADASPDETPEQGRGRRRK